ncbi:hypothetical protein ABS238_18835, partial [Acinetobacter nosocomialis]
MFNSCCKLLAQEKIKIAFFESASAGYLAYRFSLSPGEFKHEVRQFEKSYDNQQAEQISLM